MYDSKKFTVLKRSTITFKTGAEGRVLTEIQNCDKCSESCSYKKNRAKIQRNDTYSKIQDTGYLRCKLREVPEGFNCIAIVLFPKMGSGYVNVRYKLLKISICLNYFIISTF